MANLNKVRMIIRWIPLSISSLVLASLPSMADPPETRLPGTFLSFESDYSPLKGVHALNFVLEVTSEEEKQIGIRTDDLVAHARKQLENAGLKAQSGRSDTSPGLAIEVLTTSTLDGGQAFTIEGWLTEPVTVKTVTGSRTVSAIVWQYTKTGYAPTGQIERLVPYVDDAVTDAIEKWQADNLPHPLDSRRDESRYSK